MIRSDKRGLWPKVIEAYVGWQVRSAFRGVWVRGALPEGGGLLVYANHPGFWDGFVAHQLGLAAGWDAYALMEEQNLARYRFLSRIGAFSVRAGDAASASESLRYARRLLQRPRSAVFVFPEGALHPGTQLGPLRRGVEVLARSCRARCVPVAIRYAVFEHQLPDVLVEVGEAHGPEPMEGFARRLGELVGRVASAASPDGFRQVVRGRRSVAERWDAFRRLKTVPTLYKA